MTELNEAFISIPYRENSEHYFIRLKPLTKRVWLDSGHPLFVGGRYDILSAAPSKVLVDPDISVIEEEVNAIANPYLIDLMASEDIPFWGGAIGYFNYEYNDNVFGLTNEDSPLAPSLFGIFDWAIIQDHSKKKSFIVFLPTCSVKKRKKILELVESRHAPKISSFTVNNLQNDCSMATYGEAFTAIQSYIAAGDTYQINYSQRFSGEFYGEADGAYLTLRKVLPSPHAAFIELGDDSVLSFSPERFIEIDNGEAKTQPIKGTIQRGKNADEDSTLAEELLNSEKNRAENLMIVDLLRNDFSKSCLPFSVKVPSLFSLESFANVHHLVSTIEGRVKPGISPLTFFMHCFPGGSITGAPKKRAMEIIHELEMFPRNIYCGSICYLSTSGHLDSNIAIRTLLVRDEKIFCWGGGGIVADSEEQSEYRESLQKINILIEALKR